MGENVMRPTGPSNLELAGAAPVTPARAGGRSARVALRRRRWRWTVSRHRQWRTSSRGPSSPTC